MPYKAEKMYGWFAPIIKTTQVRSKILLASRLSLAGTPTLSELKSTLKIATNKLTEPRNEEESVFLEDLASRILKVELEESNNLVDRMILMAKEQGAG